MKIIKISIKLIIVYSFWIINASYILACCGPDKTPGGICCCALICSCNSAYCPKPQPTPTPSSEPDPKPDPEPPPCVPSCFCPSSPDRGYGTYSVSCGGDGCGGSCGNRQAACSPATCPSGFTKASSHQEALNICNQPSDKGDFGGNYECEIVVATPNPAHQSSCRNNGEYCYRKKTCAEIYQAGPDFKDSYRPSNFNQHFIPDSDHKKMADGQTGYRCGRYEEVASSWWQVANANLYARDKIDNNPLNINLENQTRSYCNDDEKCSAYHIRSHSNICGSDKNNQAGLQMTNQDSASSLTSTTYRTQRSNSNIGAYPAFQAQQEGGQINNFDNFAQLLNYDSLPLCNNALPFSDKQICKQIGNFTIDNNLKASGKQVVFVQGNLNIGRHAKIEVSNGNFLAFIVQNAINIDAEVGQPIAGHDHCATINEAQIQGVYIADQLNIDKKSANDIFNHDSTCDLKLIMAGTFVAWKNDLKLNRSFRGCSGEPGSTNYHNYNKDNPSITILYRPDLLINMPDWMKLPKKTRLEVI